MALEPIDLLKERLSEMNEIDSKDIELLRLKKVYKHTIDFLELYRFKKEYSKTKLTDKDINRIKRIYKWGQRIQLSYEYNVADETISAIVRKSKRFKKFKKSNLYV